MRKFAAVILALAMVLSLCACGDSGVRTPNEPEPATAAPAETEPEEVKVEPPIEISEFSDPEDVPAPTDSGEYPEEALDESLAVTASDGRTYDFKWLYEHNVHDWLAAGIAFDPIDELSDAYLALPLTDDAIATMKQKISDFTELTFMGGTAEAGIKSVAPVITVGDEEYGLDWMSSHNATEYTEAGIDADIVSQYLEAIADYSYTREYRWIHVVYDRLVNGF